jgi:hypothetical protein
VRVAAEAARLFAVRRGTNPLTGAARTALMESRVRFFPDPSPKLVVRRDKPANKLEELSVCGSSVTSAGKIGPRSVFRGNWGSFRQTSTDVCETFVPVCGSDKVNSDPSDFRLRSKSKSVLTFRSGPCAIFRTSLRRGWRVMSKCRRIWDWAAAPAPAVPAVRYGVASFGSFHRTFPLYIAVEVCVRILSTILKQSRLKVLQYDSRHYSFNSEQYVE